MMKKFTLVLLGTFVTFLFANKALASTGTGTESDPYNVASAITNQNSQTAWVKGYIVGGIVDDNNQTTTIDGPEDVVFGANVRNTAVLIADSKDETDYTKCVAVNLPTGAIRTAVNLKDNPSNLGKELIVNGTLRTYFNIPGVRDLTGYKLEENGNTPDPQPEGVVFSETFASNQGSFSIEDVTLPSGSTYVWKWDTYKYMKASAFIGSAKESESWLISPAIDLTGKTAATLSFDHTGKYFTADKLSEQVVLISTNYSSESPSTATWTALTIPNWPTGDDWNFVNSGDISLSSIAENSSVRFAFKYISTTSGAATWEIKNVVVKANDASGIQSSVSEQPWFDKIGSNLIVKNLENGAIIEIYNTTGSKIQTSIFSGNAIEIKNLSKGIYIVRAGKYTQKIIF